MLELMGRKTYFNPTIPTRPDPKADKAPEAKSGREDDWVEMRILVTPDRVRAIVGDRLHYEKFLRPGEAKKIEFFAENGAAEFGRVDVWQRTYPADYKPRRTANTG